MTQLETFKEAIANKTLDDMNKHFKNTKANKGFGMLGPWPGEDPAKKVNYDEFYSCAVRLEVDTDGEFTYGSDPNRKTVPAMRLQFKYEAELPEGAFPFDGMWADIPWDISALPNERGEGKGGKQQARVLFQMARIKGSLETMLDVQYDSLTDAVSAFLKKQDEAESKGVELVAKVKLEFRQNTYIARDKTERTRLEKLDYIQEILQTSS